MVGEKLVLGTEMVMECRHGQFGHLIYFNYYILYCKLVALLITIKITVRDFDLTKVT